MIQIAALFVRKDSVYKTLPCVDCYDIERDARTWKGGCPAIAHPPCRSWGCLKAFAKAPAGEHELGLWAVEQAMRWGGVVEHPLGSSLFREMGVLGSVIVVDQHRWGHPARKRTMLAIFGAASIPTIPEGDGKPVAVVDRPSSHRVAGAEKPKWCTKRERERARPRRLRRGSWNCPEDAKQRKDDEMATQRKHPVTHIAKCCASCRLCVPHHPPDDPVSFFCSRNADGTHAPGPGSPWTRWGGGSGGGLSCMSHEFNELRKEWDRWCAGREVGAEMVCQYYDERRMR